MPIYEFEAKDGEIHEELFGPYDAPLGKRIKRKGKWYTRIASPLSGFKREDIAFVSKQMPRWDPTHTGGYTAKGEPYFTNRKQATERAARVSGSQDTEMTYGEM